MARRTFDTINKDRVQHADLRFGTEGLDEVFLDLVDELNESYYEFWKRDLSYPFLSGQAPLWDVQPTLKESKALFDELHGSIWTTYGCVKHLINKRRPVGEQVDENEYRWDRNDLDQITGDRIQDAADRVKMKPDFLQKIKSELNTRFGFTLPWLELGL